MQRKIYVGILALTLLSMLVLSGCNIERKNSCRESGGVWRTPINSDPHCDCNPISGGIGVDGKCYPPEDERSRCTLRSDLKWSDAKYECPVIG